MPTNQTALEKTIKRRTNATASRKGNRRIIVTLEVGDMLGFRLERTRQIYRVRVEDIFQKAALWHYEGQRRKIEARAKQIAKGGVHLRTARKMAREELNQ